ncbi:hypothetical protein OO006_04250 [Prosthecochloris sp. SCSIO W1101]|uniref:hypothetical protein n=1 Tax=Prosthecochloris sp. SCSIO W1101 TaxID=2992242 RepID=UPI00223DD422|nr:hypothetical protein [Prosthecochloris sp. SCSIO W1101]UZJ42192.1 hypothetical protein OO006_04250 [Prosthecochloris sp. SCSIO W1101]
MLLANIIEENRMLRSVNARHADLLDLERARNRVLTRNLDQLTVKFMQAQGLLDDTACIVRHESDYHEGEPS